MPNRSQVGMFTELVAITLLIIWLINMCAGLSSASITGTATPAPTPTPVLKQQRAQGSPAPEATIQELTLLEDMVAKGQIMKADWVVGDPVSRSDPYQIYMVETSKSQKSFAIPVSIRPITGSKMQVFLWTDYHDAFAGNILFAIVDFNPRIPVMHWFSNLNKRGSKILSSSQW